MSRIKESEQASPIMIELYSKFSDVCGSHLKTSKTGAITVIRSTHNRDIFSGGRKSQQLQSLLLYAKLSRSVNGFSVRAKGPSKSQGMTFYLIVCEKVTQSVALTSAGKGV